MNDITDNRGTLTLFPGKGKVKGKKYPRIIYRPRSAWKREKVKETVKEKTP